MQTCIGIAQMMDTALYISLSDFFISPRGRTIRLYVADLTVCPQKSNIKFSDLMMGYARNSCPYVSSYLNTLQYYEATVCINLFHNYEPQESAFTHDYI